MHEASPKPRDEAAAPGAPEIRRYRLGRHQRLVARIGPGECYATAGGELITTTLGSCIAACVRSLDTGIGGMNHFLLPDRAADPPWDGTPVSACARYGAVAMEQLLNLVLGDDLRRDRLEIKIFGGAKVLQGHTDVGGRNIDFVRRYLRTEGLTIAAQDVGGRHGRRLVYDPRTGAAYVRRLADSQRDGVAGSELAHLERVRRSRIAGAVELFGQPAEGRR